MNTSVPVVRAIGSEFAQRKLNSLIIIYAIVVSLLMVGAVWLTTINVWWWLLAVPVIVLALAGFVALLAVRLLIRFIRPELNKVQKKAVKDFVDKLERVAENLQTPMFVIVFRVVRDMLLPRKETFIKTVASDSTSLHKDFSNLVQDFKT